MAVIVVEQGMAALEEADLPAPVLLSFVYTSAHIHGTDV